MKNTPLLTDFPKTIIATSRRILQAAVRRAREAELREGGCGYASLFGDVLPPAFLAGIDPTTRQRHYGHVPVLWAWIGQLIEGNAPCRRAVQLVGSWHAAAGLEPPVADTSCYCRARGRMDDGFLDAVSDRVSSELARAAGDGGTWRGLRLKAFDGSSLGLPDTPANQGEFPQPSSQKPGCGFPVMGFCAAFDLSSGAMLGQVTADQDTHDAVLGGALLDHVGEGDLLLGDRAFCSYELVAGARMRGAHTLMRLHQARHRKLDWRRGRAIGKDDRLVTWEKPVQQPKSSRLSPEGWAALPDTLAIRYMRIGFEDREGLKRTLVIATTLTDHRAYPKDEALELYCVRWQIKVRFRDIKTTMGMGIIDVKTPEMARRTLRVITIVHNLLRLLMIRAADEAGEPRDRMSFKAAMDAVASYQPRFSGLLRRPRLRAQMMTKTHRAISDRPVPLRLFRDEPRAVKRRPKTYQLMTKPREVFREEPHGKSTDHSLKDVPFGSGEDF